MISNIPNKKTKSVTYADDLLGILVLLKSWVIT